MALQVATELTILRSHWERHGYIYACPLPFDSPNYTFKRFNTRLAYTATIATSGIAATNITRSYLHFKLYLSPSIPITGNSLVLVC